MHLYPKQLLLLIQDYSADNEQQKHSPIDGEHYQDRRNHWRKRFKQPIIDECYWLDKIFNRPDAQ